MPYNKAVEAISLRRWIRETLFHYGREMANTTLEQLSAVSTATITSVLRDHGLLNTFMHGVTPLRNDCRMAGQAFTLRYIPAREDLDDVPVDNHRDVQRLGIEQVGAGDVFVIDARGDTRAGTLGSILAARLHRRGVAGIVTDGAYRDSPAIRDVPFALYAAAMNANASRTIHHPSETQVPIACGGVAIFPRDVVVGDGEGVVVIPSHLTETVAREATAHEDLEEFILERVQGGASIVANYPPDEQTLREYEAWTRSRK